MRILSYCREIIYLLAGNPFDGRESCRSVQCNLQITSHTLLSVMKNIWAWDPYTFQEHCAGKLQGKKDYNFHYQCVKKILKAVVTLVLRYQ